MATTDASPPGPVSVTEAVRAAAAHTRDVLFPVRLERWLVLGFLAFLDQCGRSLHGGGPGGGRSETHGPWPRDGNDFARDVVEGVDRVTAWLSAHAAAVALGALAVLLLVCGLLALVLWVNARGTFAYLDGVASGRAEIARPWRVHASAAHSYFGWRFGLSLATFFVVLLGAALVAAGLVGFARGQLEGLWGGAAALALLPVLLVLCVTLPLLVLAGVVLRDFVAPLQLTTGSTCGEAARVLEALVIAHPGAFVVYLLLKLVLAGGIGVAVFVGGCLTCCLGFVPIVMQTLFQPLFFFERSWPVFLLRQMGHDLPGKLVARGNP
jgi:hypothetical protein